jgi:hypothetical protein
VHRNHKLVFPLPLLLLRVAILFVPLIIFSNDSHSQEAADSIISRIQIDRFTKSIRSNSEHLQEKMLRKSLKALDRFARISRKLDSNAAKDLQAKVFALKNSIKHPVISRKVTQYIPRLDSLKMGLSFLDQNGASQKVKEALSSTALLQKRFEQAEEIREFLKEKREELKAQLEKLGLGRQLKKINKEVYYYSARIKEYKEIFKDPKKIEKKALELLSKTKLFQDFFKKNSILASLFRMPGDPTDPTYLASLQGLQTRAQVNALVQQQVMAGGPNGMQQFTANLQSARGQLNELQNRILKAGGGSSDAEMPEGFKPNSQKTKSFLKRLEYGTNIQSQKSSYLFPTTSDIGLSLGYKLNDKSTVGVGASYKIGWGRGWDHLNISSEGVGLRSYIDWKIKGALWISGGFEMNYRSGFTNLSQLQHYDSWQRSGLLGISKVLPIKTKLFKKTKLMLLWDFLSYEQVPRGQPIIFRIGYNIK